MSLTRRHMLSGLMAMVPVAAEARLERSFRPMPRPADLGPGSVPSADGILGDSGLRNVTGYVLRDLESGRIVEQHRPDAALPPASVTKSITALYGLSALGPEYRFRTQVAVTGPVRDGRVDGDLYLIGGGDPHLDTDGLADLAEQVVKAGIFGVNGRAYVVDGSLPYHRSIDPEQPEYVGYNPAISGMNLNFNRVHFDWKPAGGGNWRMMLTARSEHHDPPVSSVEMRIVDGPGPVFTYRQAEGRDLWSVSAKALGRGGARWLPVRVPAIYSGEVFRVLGAKVNLRLPDLVSVTHPPADARVVASIESASIEAMTRAMLKYSTNLTAEVIGLRACQVRGGTAADISQSSGAMGDWLRGNYGLSAARFVNHSGLSDETRMTAAEMVQVLDIAASGPLPALLKDIPLLDAQRRRAPVGNVRVRAKTGTLNFTRALSGYLDGQNGKRLAFAIFAADLEARASVEGRSAEVPRGSKRWIGLARGQEMALLRRWAKLYGV